MHKWKHTENMTFISEQNHILLTSSKILIQSTSCLHSVAKVCHTERAVVKVFVTAHSRTDTHQTLGRLGSSFILSHLNMHSYAKSCSEVLTT